MRLGSNEAMSLVPKYNELMWPTLQAVKELGGSASNSEIVQKVVELEGFSEDVQNEMHNEGPISKLEYRMAWARTYLKKFGALENSERGVWSITELGEQLREEQMPDVVIKVREITSKDRKTKQLLQDDNGDSGEEGSDNDVEWKAELLDVLQNQVSPAAFERLVQRTLRESGFVEVEVTGKAGDGGIDGYGVLKVGLLSFRVIFQCKRYKETVGPNYIRDFRGAMQGRAEKGLFMTTGSFTSAAKKEALRDGAPPIDIFDGNDICELIKSLKLGIDVQNIETISVNKSWFENL
jgi:restriction system protein